MSSSNVAMSTVGFDGSEIDEVPDIHVANTEGTHQEDSALSLLVRQFHECVPAAVGLHA